MEASCSSSADLQIPHPDVTEESPQKRKKILTRRYDNKLFIMHDKKLKRTLPIESKGRDVLPEPVPALSPAPSFVYSSGDNIQRIPMPVSGTIDTPANSFGMFRRYHGAELPTHDPEREVNLAMLSNLPVIAPTTAPIEDPYNPYPNKASFLLGDWYWNGGSQKSQANFDSLVAIIGSQEFSPDDIRHTPWRQINDQLGANDWDKGEWQDEDAGWYQSSITIQVPFHYLTDNPGVRPFTVDGFYHRSLVSIIQERIRNDAHDNSHFHFTPFELLWDPGDSNSTASAPVRLQGELYTSPVFLDAHKDLQSTLPEPGCLLPRVVVSLMFWSDATHLTNFGNAKLWPLYMLFGNDSKYQRCKPSGNLCEHVAYFEHVSVSHYFYFKNLISEKLPDSFKEFASKFMGKKKTTPEFLAYCHRELTHEQWRFLLDDEFIHAYEHGIVIECGDGIMRRFYPRIFTYSADYPEKYVYSISGLNVAHVSIFIRVLMSSIRNLGGCPCPRCKIALSDAHLVGTKKDRKQRLVLARRDDVHRQHSIHRARDAIYDPKRYLAVDSAYVERQLKPESLVPTSVSET